MAELKKIISRIRFVPRRTKKLTVVMVIVAIVLSLGALAALHISMIDLQNRTEDLRDKASLLEEENAQLLEDIDGVDSVHGIIKIAEEELGLVQPDSEFYKPES